MGSFGRFSFDIGDLVGQRAQFVGRDEFPVDHPGQERLDRAGAKTINDSADGLRRHILPGDFRPVDKGASLHVVREKSLFLQSP